MDIKIIGVFMIKEKRLTLLIIVIAIIAVVSVSGCIGDSSDDSSSEAAVSEDIDDSVEETADSSDSSSDDDEAYQSSSSSDRSNPYWASTIRDKFHRSSCEWAQEIDDVNLVTYPNRDAAIADGKVPCKVCEP